MFGIKQSRRKPDLLLLVTIFVCLGVVVTTTVNATPPAAPTGSSWGLQLEAKPGCQHAWAEWRGCNRLSADAGGDLLPAADETLRAAVSLSSERLPDTDLVWYYTQTQRQQGKAYGLDLRLNNDALATGRGADNHQFGMALKRRYGNLGLSLGLEAERVDNLTDDPLIYFGTSYGW